MKFAFTLLHSAKWRVKSLIFSVVLLISTNSKVIKRSFRACMYVCVCARVCGGGGVKNKAATAPSRNA